MQYLSPFLAASPTSRSIPNRTASAIRLALLLSLVLMTCVLCSGMDNAPMPQTNPAIIINPTVGPPTTSVMVAGSGFDPYAAVDIYFDVTDLALVTTNGAGAFGGSLFGGIPIQVPASALPGNHWITAVERYRIKAAQKPFLVRTDWAQFHFSPDHKGVNPYENVLSPQTAGGLGLDWSYSTPNLYLLNSPVVANGLVSFCDNNYTLSALNAATGGPPLWTWSYCFGFGPAVDTKTNTLYMGSDQNSLYWFNATTGAYRGELSLQGIVIPEPTVSNGIVYLATGFPDFVVYAFDPTTQTVKWTFSANDYIYSSPSLANGVLYFGSDDGYLYALSADTGTLRWKYGTGSYIQAAPAVDNGVVYAASFNGYLYAFNVNNGSILWQQPIAGWISSPAVANGVVYIGSGDGSVNALNARTGASLWRFSTGGRISSSPAVANGVVYVGSGDSSIYALNASTGELLWSYATGGAIEWSSPAVANGMVYIGSDDGNLYAFSLTGELSKNFSPPERPDPRLLVPDYSLRPDTPVTAPNNSQPKRN